MGILFRWGPESGNRISMKLTLENYKFQVRNFFNNLVYAPKAYSVRKQIVGAGASIHRYGGFDPKKTDGWIDDSLGFQKKALVKFFNHTCGGDAAVAYAQLYCAAAKGRLPDAFNEKSYLHGLYFSVLTGERTDRDQTTKDLREIRLSNYIDFNAFPSA